VLVGGIIERMFGTVDQALDREREVCEREIREICVRRARDDQRLTLLVRGADDRGFWQAAGCSSSAQWRALLSSSDHRTAVRITQTADALRSLPALDEAMSTGALSLDQVAAAAEFATPETDAELARVAVGKAPSAIGHVARTLAPPVVENDQALYARRSLRMTWMRGRRELAISGRLPLELGVVFEQAIWEIAKEQRAADKRDGAVVDWQQSAADALVSLAQTTTTRDGIRQSAATLIVHLPDDAPPFLEGAGPISPETAERLGCAARRLWIQRRGRDVVYSRVTRCASYAQLRALHKRSDHCQWPGCTATRELKAHHLTADEHGGKTEIANLILLCRRHHTVLHDHHIHTTGTGDQPIFTTEDGRVISTNHAHGPPS
jgi:hypothetical protein